MSGKPEGYVEVHTRIKAFYEKYPEGSLRGAWRVETIGEDTLIVYCGEAFRTPQDERPGIGWASEPYPGKTNFTRDSELMNAETSAWGRALAALGFEVHSGIASASEVRNRGGDPDRKLQGEATANQKRALTRTFNDAGVSGEMQKKIVHALAGNPPSKQGASEMLDVLKGEGQLDMNARIDSLIAKAELGTSDVPAETNGLPTGEPDEGTELDLEARAEAVDQSG